MTENEILKCGKYITDDNHLVNCYDAITEEIYNEWIRIRIISYEGNLYYYKMINGECSECKLIGRSL